jgi:hypothetical protein
VFYKSWGWERWGLATKNGWRQLGFVAGGGRGEADKQYVSVAALFRWYSLLLASSLLMPASFYKRYSALKTQENFLVDRQH